MPSAVHLFGFVGGRSRAQNQPMRNCHHHRAPPHHRSRPGIQRQGRVVIQKLHANCAISLPKKVAQSLLALLNRSDTKASDSLGTSNTQTRRTLKMVLTGTSAPISKECVCCNESKQTNEFPSTAPTPACQHEAVTCSECLQLWWTATLENNYWPVLACPDCPEIVCKPKCGRHSACLKPFS